MTTSLIEAGNGVVLRLFQPEDAEPMFALIDRNRKHLSQYGEPTARKYPDVSSVLESIMSPPDEKMRFGVWVDGTLVGSVNLKSRSRTIGEIGYWLASEYTGKGYATCAVQALRNYAFRSLGFESIGAEVHKDNLASQRVLERAGFTNMGRPPLSKEKEDIRLFMFVSPFLIS